MIWGIGWSLVFWLGIGLVIAKACGFLPDMNWTLVSAPIWGPLLLAGMILGWLIGPEYTEKDDEDDERNEW